MAPQTVPVTYIGIHDEVHLPALGDPANPFVVKHGETRDVRADVAGRPPVGYPGEQDYDPGEGLLAQPENWSDGREQADNPYDANMSQVLAHVGDDPQRAAAALAFERDNKNRKGLVAKLEAIAGDATIAEPPGETATGAAADTANPSGTTYDESVTDTDGG